MKLVVGLGNPGAGYADTYHNIGFIALDILAERFNAPEFSQPGYAKKSNAVTSEIVRGGSRVLLVKPQTYMNLSGDAVSGIAGFFKVAPEDILVIYDDIDIKKGTVRARASGSAGTHNGMRDIVAKLGSQNFARVRIGTGLKPGFMELADYVLSHIQAFEKPLLLKACEAACDFCEAWIDGTPRQEQTVTVV